MRLAKNQLLWHYLAVVETMEGRVLRDRYRLLSKLGRGGMGSVWRARDLNLSIDVAVKLIDPTFADSPDALARFQREALAGAGLRCTHIVHVTDYGVDDGTPFIAMDLLEGESLATRLIRQRKLPFNDTLLVLSQVEDALTFAHNKRIVHRDLKPDNVFITLEGSKEIVKVLDFGVAKNLDAQSLGDAIKTHTGAMLGTPYYMSPEQTRSSSTVDHRTDIWSLGVIAYECVTGRRPFKAETLPDLLMAICRDPVLPPSQIIAVPAGFDQWFAKATAREVDARFQCAAEAVEELRCVVRPRARVSKPVVDTKATLSAAANTAEQPTEWMESVVPSSVTSPGVQRSRRRRRWVGSASVAAVAAAGLCYWAWPSSNSEAPNAASSSVDILAATPTTMPNTAPATAASSTAVQVVPGETAASSSMPNTASVTAASSTAVQVVPGETAASSSVEATPVPPASDSSETKPTSTTKAPVKPRTVDPAPPSPPTPVVRPSKSNYNPSGI